MKIKGILMACGITVIVSVVPCIAQEAMKNSVLTGSGEAIKTVSADRKDAIGLARDYMNFERMKIIAQNLELSPKEQEGFWQEYGRYQSRLEPLRERAVNLIVTYASKFYTIDGGEAKQMLDELLNIQQDEITVRREFLSKFEAILPLKKVVRFYQIDNKINAEIRYQLSLEIPLLETVAD